MEYHSISYFLTTLRGIVIASSGRLTDRFREGMCLRRLAYSYSRKSELTHLTSHDRPKKTHPDQTGRCNNV